LYVRPTCDNAEKLISALGAFGFNSPELSVQDFTKIDRVVQLGDPPVRSTF
jgi:hypothetical protein